MFLRKKT